VPNAGAFDGVLGVVIGLGLIEQLEGLKLDYAIEVVAFSEEEGVRFGVPFLGSRALVGTLDAELLARRDDHQISVEQAVRDFGVDPDQIPEACMGQDYAAYLEFHIEQGPVLEQIGVGLGVVETIVGQTRMDCTFRGQANHAGTTPMFLRKDPLTAASEWVLAVENRARATPGLVGTVGQLEVSPGAGNVVPGEVKLTLDVRHAMNHTRTSAVNSLLTEARRIAATRGVEFEATLRLDQPAVPMNDTLIQQLGVSVFATGYPLIPITSGAGHDAMVMAGKLPCAMLFLRSPGGISHHPNETVLVPDVQAAVDVGLHFLENLNLQQL
jgi:allantoate deiminase